MGKHQEEKVNVFRCFLGDDADRCFAEVSVQVIFQTPIIYILVYWSNCIVSWYQQIAFLATQFDQINGASWVLKANHDHRVYVKRL